MAQTKVSLIKDGVIVVGHLHTNHGITTGHIGEGSNLYFTDARVMTSLGSVSTHIIPDTNIAYDLGSPTNRFRDLYLSSNTIHLGTDTKITVNNDGEVEFKDSSDAPKRLKVRELDFVDDQGRNKRFKIDATSGRLATFDAVGTLTADKLDLSAMSTTDLSEGSNLYYTDARVGTYLTTNSYATQVYVNQKISDLVASAPTTLDTLNELAAALGDDPNFATTVSGQIGTKWTQDNAKIANWDAAYGWGNHASIGYLTTVGWNDVTGKPSTFTPSAHNHDDRYYTETESDARFLGIGAKAADSNLLDGIDSSSFLRSNATDYFNSSSTSSRIIFEVKSGSLIASAGDNARFPLQVHAPNGSDAAITFHIDNDFAGYFGLDAANNDLFWGGWSVGSSTKYRIWHSGNDGSGSGLDADTVDGIQGSSIITTTNKNDYTYPPQTHSHNYISEGGTSFNGQYPVAFRIGSNNYYSNNSVQLRGSDGRLTIVGSISMGYPGNGSTTNARFLSIEGSTDAGGEGSGRIFFTEHNSTSASMDNYGMSIGYRGGATTITGASGNDWTGLSQIGNGQWGMWGHNNDATGALIMYGDRAATFVDFAGNNIQGIGNITASGILTINGSDGVSRLHINGTTPTINLDDSNGDSFFIHVNSNNFYVLADRDGGGNYGDWDGNHPLQLEADTNIGYLFGSRIFSDAYHPDANKWTTARTITLGGDLTGSVSIDGSANVTLSAQVVNDSHTHDGRYYTESESDARFTSKDHFRSTGTGYYTSTTTSALITEALGDGAFDSYLTAHKTGWSYAGNGNLTDAGRLTELAGSSWLWWTDNPADGTQGNITGLCIAPNTGGSAGKVFIYNNQGSDYAPGWREVWTSSSDGSGSGLDADLLDGNHASAFQPAGNYAPAGGSAGTDWYCDDLFYDQWIRNNGTGDSGLYWHNSSHAGYAWHIYPQSRADMTFRTGLGNGGIKGTVGDATARGYVHWTTSNEIGFLNNSRSWSLRVDSSGNTFATGSHRAPIFYDSNNTGYYANPASTSVFNDFRCDIMYDKDNTAYYVRPGSTSILNDARANIWYSRSNTGYYCDPESTSNFNALTTAGTISAPYIDINKTSTYGSSMQVTFSGAQSSGIFMRNNRGSTADGISFYYSNAAQPARGNISISSTSVSYNSLSDYRAKENVVPLTGAIDRVSLLKPSRFNFIGNEKTVDGFLAHEVQEVVPQAVNGDKDAVDSEGNNIYQSMDAAKLVPLLTAALQEAIAKIESLEARIQVLENQ